MGLGIEDHGVIGDLNIVALVGIDGSVDFMCFPDFDSPTIFGALLDEKNGGVFRISPLLEHPHHKQIYLSDTNVLFTRFLSADGVAEISDFMPVASLGHGNTLVRRAKTVRGEIRFRISCAPAFNYGRSPHRVETTADGVRFVSDDLALLLRSSVPLREDHGAAVGEFTLGAGEIASFVLEQLTEETGSLTAGGHYIITSFKETVNYWRRWLGMSRYRGRWRETVNRSALVLKLLTHQRHGSIVASPTFGLPETLGGTRNWDYRYTWIRDASFTLYALIRLGFTEEARSFMTWLEARCDDLAPDATLPVMYRLNGGRDLAEQELSHWKGYQGSRPVRIGNAASMQTQLDIYGELMDAVYLYDKHGERIAYDFWRNLERLIDWVCRNWNTPDDGIWEVRGGQQQFLYSKFMCWVALDRGIRLAHKRSFPAPVDRWVAVRDEIYREIMQHYWDDGQKTFTQCKHTSGLDASHLLMPLVRFISPTDPRWLSTLAAIEQNLIDDSHVYRYDTSRAAPDGVGGKEGTFCMCTFWYVEALARSGDLDKARFIFEKILGYANHLGLFAEELGPSGGFLGNFPQAFTHVSLISAAFDLHRRLDDARKD